MNVVGSEKNFENKVKDFLKEKNCWFLKTWSNGVQRSGVPDILACFGGHFLGIELKAPNGKPSELQIYNLGEIHKSGGYAILLYPKDFELFKKLVCGLDGRDVQQVIEAYLHFDRLRKEWEKRLGL